DTVIYPFTVIERGVKIGKRCSVGPFAHLREAAELKDDVTAGNFIEMVRAKIGAKTFVKHFSYIGDSSVGSCVNIGAGTVTANFDGIKKNNTVIQDKANIGSDTVIVAPVKIGRSAFTGAGSVITKNVPDNAVVAGVPARILRKR
ncbi:MAG: UDP-N-acetylglucosamine diphosphorylase/glucosamine-1-phosphate N-acetyltransferase, partial [Candidatus Omnitrophica bacterium]|nr:UDP-N-acetylglucosamine diphosphorylase/glucosamine-1-phosphate N-acetyltransferase [Candidatus Omnitrophota bacterium]